MRGTMNEPEKLLVERAQRGDRSAFDDLFALLADRVRAFIRERIRPAYRSRLDVEEVLQDTFVRAFRSIDSFHGEDLEGFRRWLTGVARKTVLRAEEGTLRHRTLEIQDSIAGKDVSPSTSMRREERFDGLERALESLSADHREVILLTRIDGLSLNEAAERMNRSPEAVRKLFWRALKELRNVMTNSGSLHLPDPQVRNLRRAEER
jgi:RNA polymerase sigma-70 factor (ECF subfamily)